MDGIVPPDLEEKAKEYFESLEDSQPDFDVLFNHTRITCFSSDPENLLMWSHYADGLRGFCIAFDDGELMAKASDRDEFLTEVEYVEAPPNVDSFTFAVAEDQLDYHLTEIAERSAQIENLGPKEIWSGELDDYRQAADEALETMQAIWRRAFAAKPRQWEYERESRLLVRTDKTDQAPVQREYPASAVRQIIFGERMRTGDRETLQRIIAREFPGVSLLQASRDRGIYRLKLTQISD